MAATEKELRLRDSQVAQRKDAAAASGRPGDPANAIECRGVTKRYDSSKAGLSGTTFEIRRGDFVFLVGPTGSGKSTLMRLLIKELEPDEGQILVAGRDLGELLLLLARALARRHAIARPEAERLIDASGAARLRAGASNGDGWRVIWKDMKSAERAYPEIALAAAQAFDTAGEPDESARVLETAINQGFSPALTAAYARCDASQVKRRIEKAEAWLKQRPNDPDLLRGLGVLCLTGQIWGAAERYLTRSLKYRNNPQTHALLGSLYDRLNRPQDAAQQWRMATAVGMALPNLAGDAALPAADTGADPRFAAAEVADLDGVYSAQGYDLEVDATEWSAPQITPLPGVDATVDTTSAEPGANRPNFIRADAPPAHQVATPSQTDLDDYLDSAPPPIDVLDDTGRNDRATQAVPVVPRGDESSKS